MWDGPERRKNHCEICQEHSGLVSDTKNIVLSQERIEDSMERFHTQMRQEVADIKKVATIAMEICPEIKDIGKKIENNSNRVTALEVKVSQDRGWLYGITLAVASVIFYILKKTI